MTNEEMERGIGFLLESQAKHDAQIAELHNIIREQSASQSELNQMMIQAITDLAEAERRTETKVERLADKVERLADKVERLADKVNRLADIVERGNARQNETDARLDRLSEVVERLVTRGE